MSARMAFEGAIKMPGFFKKKQELTEEQLQWNPPVRNG